MKDNVYCDACGEEIYKRIGFVALLEEEENDLDIAKIRNKFGKTRFRICWTCVLLSFGVKARDDLKDGLDDNKAK